MGFPCLHGKAVTVSFLVASGLAWAEPCQYNGVASTDPESENIENAFDDNDNTWAEDSRIYLELELANQPIVQSVGLRVKIQQDITYSATIWYWPTDGSPNLALVEDTGDLSAGSYSRTWEAGVETSALLWVFDQRGADTMKFQVLCETGGSDTGSDGGLDSGWFEGGVGCGCNSNATPVSPLQVLMAFAGLTGALIRSRRP